MAGRREHIGRVADGALARRASLGDRHAFAEIVRRHGAPMFRYASSMLDGDAAEAEDAVQNALIKAWQGLPRFEGRSALRTWLFRITANEVLQARRRRRPVPVDGYLLVDRAAPCSSTGRRRQRRSHRTGWPRQSCGRPWCSPCRSCRGASGPAGCCARWRACRTNEIAQVLGTTDVVVRGQLHRARRSLASRMEQWR